MADGMSTRRVVAAVLGLGALSLGVAAPAASQPPPNCSSADLAGVMTGVLASTTAYLYTHPPVNAFFTTIGDLDPEQRRVALAEFLDTNPQVRAELQGIRAPAVDFRNRCGREIPELGEN
ncbi:heme-binding protein [uncultured Mycolicibacterium sp.]|uniref:heme-binding protein n=1 Tax=uncultured Mycolicibacterium sp. TaxID=2320817 RepID=UPI0032B1115F